MKIKTKLHLIMAILAVVLVGGILLAMNFLIIPIQREDIVEKARHYAYSLQEVAPMLNQAQMQQLVNDMAARDPQLSYLLLLDLNGKAVVHSEQADSRYQGEKTIDILIPNYDKEGNHIGAINIGVSMEYWGQMVRRHYLVFFISGAFLLLIFYLAAGKLYRDITAKQRFEEGLIKVAKFESWGILVSGLAHDFNNLLMVIAGNIGLARMMSEEINGSNEFLDEAEKAIFQARDLARQLLIFSRGGEPVKKMVSAVNFLRNSVNFALSGSNVCCEFIIPEQLWNMEVDEGQISQVLNNLVINAIQAMPDGGTIRIAGENVDIDNPDEKIPLAAGKYIRFSIADQGQGIPEKHYSRIFDPYFTTKENGSGLGLAASQLIIRKHGGYLTFDSYINKGTIFYVYLPVRPEE